MKAQTKEHGNDISMKAETDLFDTEHYIINKRLLCIHGQWPYQSTTQRVVRVSIALILCSTFLIPQYAMVFRSFGNNTLFIECLSSALTSVGCILKMINCLIAASKIKEILDEIRSDWINTSLKEEKKILVEYGRKGRIATISYLVVIVSTVTMWVLTPLVPTILDRLAPLNQTRPRIVVYHMDYKSTFNIDQDIHPHLAHLHGALMCGYGILMLVAADTLYMAISQHLCGMFRILRYRLENVWDESINASSDVFNVDLQDDICYQTIIDCLKIHKRLVHSVRLLEASNEWVLLVVLFASIASIPCVGYQAVNPTIPKQDAARFLMFAIAGIVHLFCNTLPGHCITCESTLLRDSVYSARWYMMSRRCRGLIVIALRRTATPSTLTAGKLWTMSMENFCAVVKTIMSYFTMLTSFQ